MPWLREWSPQVLGPDASSSDGAIVERATGTTWELRGFRVEKHGKFMNFLGKAMENASCFQSKKGTQQQHVRVLLCEWIFRNKHRSI